MVVSPWASLICSGEYNFAPAFPSSQTSIFWIFSSGKSITWPGCNEKLTLPPGVSMCVFGSGVGAGVGRDVGLTVGLGVGLTVGLRVAVPVAVGMCC